jgi:hypothetical protein
MNLAVIVYLAFLTSAVLITSQRGEECFVGREGG